MTIHLNSQPSNPINSSKHSLLKVLPKYNYLGRIKNVIIYPFFIIICAPFDYTELSISPKCFKYCKLVSICISKNECPIVGIGCSLIQILKFDKIVIFNLINNNFFLTYKFNHIRHN